MKCLASLKADRRVVSGCLGVSSPYGQVCFVSERERTNLCHDADGCLGRLERRGIKIREKTEGENVK